MNKWFDNLSTIVKVVLLFPIWGWVVGALYRISKYLESKNTMTLVGAVLFFIPPVGFVLSIVDIITAATQGKIVLLAD